MQFKLQFEPHSPVLFKICANEVETFLYFVYVYADLAYTILVISNFLHAN
jgi:hypothetical protein